MGDDVLSTSSSRVEQFMLLQGYTQQSTTDRATLIDHMYFSEQIGDDVAAVQVRDVYYSDAVYCSVPLSVLYSITLHVQIIMAKKVTSAKQFFCFRWTSIVSVIVSSM